MLLFESIITVYLLEEDVSRELIESHSWADNGTLETTKRTCFNAISNAMTFAVSNVGGRQIFGDWLATAALKAVDDNYAKVLKFLDDLVDKRIKK